MPDTGHLPYIEEIEHELMRLQLYPLWRCESSDMMTEMLLLTPYDDLHVCGAIGLLALLRSANLSTPEDALYGMLWYAGHRPYCH